MISQTIIICPSCPINPPITVHHQSVQSHLLPYNLSLYSIPEANPMTQMIVKRKPTGMAYSRCLSLFDSLIQAIFFSLFLLGRVKNGESLLFGYFGKVLCFIVNSKVIYLRWRLGRIFPHKIFSFVGRQDSQAVFFFQFHITIVCSFYSCREVFSRH